MYWGEHYYDKQFYMTLGKKWNVASFILQIGPYSLNSSHLNTPVGSKAGIYQKNTLFTA